VVALRFLSSAYLHLHNNQPIFDAIAHCDAATASRLLAAGTCVNALGPDGQGVWSYAVPAGAKSVQLALDCGANPNLLDSADRSGLYWAIQSNSAESAELLIEAGAKVESVESGDAFNLLHEAAMSGADDVLGVFAKHARAGLFSERNVFGRTPYEEALDAGNSKCAALLASYS
jgi:ankyrin repeat protein